MAKNPFSRLSPLFFAQTFPDLDWAITLKDTDSANVATMTTNPADSVTRRKEKQRETPFGYNLYTSFPARLAEKKNKSEPRSIRGKSPRKTIGWRDGLECDPLPVGRIMKNTNLTPHV